MYRTEMAEDKRTIVILIRVRKQGFVMFLCSFVLWTLIISDPVYKTPPHVFATTPTDQFHVADRTTTARW